MSAVRTSECSTVLQQQAVLCLDWKQIEQKASRSLIYNLTTFLVGLVSRDPNSDKSRWHPGLCCKDSVWSTAVSIMPWEHGQSWWLHSWRVWKSYCRRPKVKVWFTELKLIVYLLLSRLLGGNGNSYDTQLFPVLNTNFQIKCVWCNLHLLTMQITNTIPILH